MRNPLAKLASDTAIYGITHSLGRFLNFLLIPLYTYVFTVTDNGVLNVYYGVVGFAIVLLLYGMETAFFSFARSHPPSKVLSTGMISVLVSTAVFLFLGLIFRHSIARFLEHPDQSIYVAILVVVLAIDALCALPLAWLRFQNKPIRFGAIRLTNILLNIGFNLLFLILFPKIEASGTDIPLYNPDFGIGYIFVSNLLASISSLLLLLPTYKNVRIGFDKELWKKMFQYARPLIWVGLAGIVNESMDRILLLKMLPKEIGDFEIGVYTVFYKISIVMTLAVQSFRFAAEPFFFERSQSKDSRKIYAQIMHYFVIVLCTIFLVTCLFAEPIARLFINREAFFTHPQWKLLIPILLLANLFLGVTYNLNIWYKLNGKTKYGMYISIFGASITLILNLILIPIIGILGSAITTFLSYFGMAAFSYYLGKKHYPIPYPVKLITFYIATAIVLYLVFELISHYLDKQTLPAILTLALFSMIVYYIERPVKKT